MERVECQDGRVSAVRLAGGERLAAGHVVLAAGPWSEAIEGLPAAARVPVRPVKGQILRLRDPAGPGLLRAGGALRGRLPGAARRWPLCAGRDRRGARLRVGGDGGRRLRAAARRARAACRASPSWRSRSSRWGCAPAPPTTCPRSAPASLRGLVWATGHYRNGILLAPLTAELVVDLVRQGECPAGAARVL